jgi:hypothetical protein
MCIRINVMVCVLLYSVVCGVWFYMYAMSSCVQYAEVLTHTYIPQYTPSRSLDTTCGGVDSDWYVAVQEECQSICPRLICQHETLAT